MKPTDWIIAAVVIFAAVYLALQSNERMEEGRLKRAARDAYWADLQANGDSSPHLHKNIKMQAIPIQLDINAKAEPMSIALLTGGLFLALVLALWIYSLIS